MPYALVTIENRDQRTWPDPLDFYVHKLPKEEGTLQIAESAWLICLDTDLIVLARLVVGAHEAKMPYHVFVSEQKPNLLSFQNTPTTKA